MSTENNEHLDGSNSKDKVHTKIRSATYAQSIPNDKSSIIKGLTISKTYRILPSASKSESTNITPGRNLQKFATIDENSSTKLNNEFPISKTITNINEVMLERQESVYSSNSSENVDENDNMQKSEDEYLCYVPPIFIEVDKDGVSMQTFKESIKKNPEERSSADIDAILH